MNSYFFPKCSETHVLYWAVQNNESKIAYQGQEVENHREWKSVSGKRTSCCHRETFYSFSPDFFENDKVILFNTNCCMNEHSDFGYFYSENHSFYRSSFYRKATCDHSLLLNSNSIQGTCNPVISGIIYK